MKKPSKPTNSSRKPPRRASPPEPTGLAELQRLMARAVMRPLTATDRMQKRWVDGQATSEIAAGFIKPNDRLSSFDRLEIYNRQYWYRLLDCLHDDYPGLRAVLGDWRFTRMSVAYLTKYPSISPNLRDLGERLARFLREEPEWARPHETLALDMARLEWAQVVAFDGESRRATTLQRLATRPPDRIHLRLQPFVTLLELSHRVDEVVIRLARQGGELRGEASNAVESSTRGRRRSIARRIKPERNWLLVHRQENSVYLKNLAEGEYRILRALQDGANLMAACESTAALDLPPEQVQGWFQTWAALGLLVAGD